MKPKFGLLALITILATLLMPLQWTIRENTSLSLIKDISAPAQTTQDRNAEAARLLQLGVQQYNQGQFREALETFQQLLVIARAIGDRQGEEVTLTCIGSVYRHLGQYPQALKFYEQALVIAKEVGDKAGGGMIFNNIGIVHYSMEEYPQALKFYEQGLVIAQEVGNKAEEGATLNNIGEVYRNLGEYPQALKFYEQALVIAQKVGNKVQEGTTLNNIGEVYRNLGQYFQALKFFEQALVIHKEVGNKVEEGTTLNNIGLVYSALGEYPQALKLFKQALVIHKEVANKLMEGATLNNLGLVYNVLGEYPRALTFFEQALVIAKAVGNKAKEEGTTLNNIGSVYINLEQYAQALKFSEQALSIAKTVGDKSMEGTTLSNLGFVYNTLGEYPQALKFYQQALVINNKVGDKAGKGTTLGNIGGVYNNLEQYAQALKFDQQALVIVKQVGDKAGEGRILNLMGGVYNYLGQYPNAEKMLFAALKVRESLRLGLTDTDKVSLFDSQASTYELLQHALLAQNKTNTALEIAERGRARAFVELLAKRLSAQSAAQLINITPPTALQMQQIAKAQNATLVQYSIISELIKVQGKKEYRASRLFIWVIPPTGRIVFRWIDLKPLLKQNSSLSELAPNSPSDIPVGSDSPAVETQPPESGKEIATPWSQPEVIILLILIASSLIAVAVWYGRFILTKKPIQNIKPQQRWLVPSLLLLLAAGSSGGLFFWMTRTQAIANNRNFRNTSLLAQLIDGTRESLKTEGRGLGIVPLGQKATQGDRLQQLHQILIQPIADLLPSDPNARVIFIPQSSLFLVPFPALKDASGKYLIEKHTILTAPSIQTLDLTRKQKQRIETLGVGSREALVVGNPTMPKVPPQIGEPPQQLPSLPGAEEEARAIASLLKTPAITGDKATKQAILQKMSNARIVHLATHGILDDIRGLGSAIALAPSGKDDGLLTAEQILDLKLNAELVVLSACDTGRGKITGDGVIGLSRSLITAGVPSVLSCYAA